MEPLPTQAKAVPKLLYSRKEAAELLSLSRSTLDAFITRGQLRSRRIGHKRLIAHADLVAFSQKNLPSAWLPGPDGKKNQRSAVSAKQMRLPFKSTRDREAADEPARETPAAKAAPAEKAKAQAS